MAYRECSRMRAWRENQRRKNAVRPVPSRYKPQCKEPKGTTLHACTGKVTEECFSTHWGEESCRGLILKPMPLPPTPNIFHYQYDYEKTND